MNLIPKHIIALLCFMLIAIVACQDEEVAPSTDLKMTAMKVFPEISVSKTYQIVSGGDVALIGYKSEFGGISVSLINESLEILWTRNFQAQLFKKIIYEPTTELFHIILNKGLYKIDKKGLIRLANSEYFQDLGLSILPVNFSLTPDGNYLAYGTVSSNGRAFVSKISPPGEQIYRRNYIIDLSGRNAFTSAVTYDDGSYVLAGGRESDVDTLRNSMFLVKYDSEGDIIWERRYELGFPLFVDGTFNIGNVSGRDLIETLNEKFIYLKAPEQVNSDRFISNLYRINPNDSTFSQTPLDYNFSNFAAGNGGSLTSDPFSDYEWPSIGTGLVKLKNGMYMGLVNPEIHNFLYNTSERYQDISSRNGYFYVLSTSGKVDQIIFPSRQYVNNFTSLTQLFSGKVLILGINQSLGEADKLTILAYE